MRSRWPSSESELAKPVVEWLKDLKWDVYQEVQTGRGRADIVATQGKIIWALECKTSCSMALLEQAYDWRQQAHYVSVVIPAHRRITGLKFTRMVLGLIGIGVLEVSSQFDGFKVDETLPPVLRHRISEGLRKELREEHKHFAEAGNSLNKFWTPFAQTCVNIREIVAKSPGITMTEMMKDLKHHYRTAATARTAIAKWGQSGVIRGVDFQEVDGQLKLFLKPLDK